MALKRNFYLNDKLVEPPKNAPELSIKFNFEKDSYDSSGRPKLALSITDFEWARENHDTILSHYESGKSFRGLPMKYELDRNGTVEKIFDGYIDLVDNPRFGRNTSTVTAKQRKNIDWLNDTADSVSFERLYELGVISGDDFKFMPYVLNKVPDYQEAAIAIFSAYYLTQEITKAVIKIGELGADTANPFSTPSAVVRAVIYVGYLIVMLVAAVLLIKKIILYIIQPVKYHACMNVKTILTKIAKHFKFTFKSEIFDKAPFDKLTFMPEKFFNPVLEDKETKQKIFGFAKPDKIKQRGYPSGTVGDFLRKIKKMFRAKIVINTNNELTLVPEYQNTGSAQYQLPELYQPEFTTNANELKANYVLSFLVDQTDKNTIQQYTGTSYQVITEFVNAVPEDLRLLKGIEDYTIEFSLAKTKKELTVPEQLIKEFLDGFSVVINSLIKVVNVLIKAVNKIIDLVKKIIKILKKLKIDIPFDVRTIPTLKTVDLGLLIENRIGMMMIETDSFANPKIFLLEEGSSEKLNKINSSNDTTVSAKYLYENYHKPVVSFLPSQQRPNGNQYIIKNFEKVGFTFSDFQKVKNNNNIFTNDGTPAIIDDGEWNDYNEKAKLTVRISKLYIPTTEIKEVYIEPTGK